MQISHIPRTTVQRLPIYLRCLVSAQSQRMDVVNSVQIGAMAGTNAAQVRKDLSYLGEFGTRGIGYDVDALIAHLMRWLGLETSRRAAIIGLGRLGSALFSYGGFRDRGIIIAAVLDADPSKIGVATDGMVVEAIDDLADVVEREAIEIAILTVPASAAQSAAEAAAAAGVKAILNFAPVLLDVPGDVVVRQADLAADLQILSFHVSEIERGRQAASTPASDGLGAKHR